MYKVEDIAHLLLDVLELFIKSLELLRDDVILIKELSELRKLGYLFVDKFKDLLGCGIEFFFCLG